MLAQALRAQDAEAARLAHEEIKRQQGEEIAEEDDLAGGMARGRELHQRIHGGKQEGLEQHEEDAPRDIGPGSRRWIWGQTERSR